MLETDIVQLLECLRGISVKRLGHAITVCLPPKASIIIIKLFLKMWQFCFRAKSTLFLLAVRFTNKSRTWAILYFILYDATWLDTPPVPKSSEHFGHVEWYMKCIVHVSVKVLGKNVWKKKITAGKVYSLFTLYWDNGGVYKNLILKFKSSKPNKNFASVPDHFIFRSGLRKGF